MNEMERMSVEECQKLRTKLGISQIVRQSKFSAAEINFYWMLRCICILEG